MRVEGTSVLPASRGRARAPGEVELIGRAKAGDREAFDPLYRTYASAVLSYALRLLRGRRDLAEDAASDGWLRAIDGIERYEPREGKTFGSWLSTTVRFRTIVHGKRWDVEAPWRGGDLATAEDMDNVAADWVGTPLWPDDVADPYDPVAEAEHEERLARLYAAVERLSPQQRAVVSMRLDGLRTADVAARLGVTWNAADIYWQRAIRLLRIALAEAPKPDPAAEARAEFDELLTRLARPGRREVRVAELVALFRRRDPSWVCRQMAEVARTGRVAGVRLRKLRPGVYELHPSRAGAVAPAAERELAGAGVAA